MTNRNRGRAGQTAHQPKNVLVTGASSGLGRACAQRLAARGFRVFAGVRREEDGEALRGELDGSVIPLLLDVTDADAIEAARVRCELDGGLFALVNNAGITVAGPIELLPLEAIRKQFDVNLFGQLAVIKAFLPLLRASEGRVLIMGSILGRLSLPFLVPYAGSKFALEAAADALAGELREWGISVSILEPGNIATPIWTKTMRRTHETLSTLPEKDWELYRARLEAFERYAEHAAESGISANRVAVVVERALRVRRPRARYAIGWDSRLLGGIAPLVPARLRQALVRRTVFRR